MEDSEFNLRYSGPEINTLLDKASTALQMDSLTPYKTDAQNKEQFVSKQANKGLSTQDFTTELMLKLVQLYTKLQLDEMFNTLVNYRILAYKTNKSTTRLQVPESQRRYAVVISYNDSGNHVTEKYINTIINDAEWQKDDNWVPLAVLNKPKRPITPGIYILDVDGFYTPWRDWKSDNSKVVGVTVIDNKASFMISLSDVSSQIWADVSTEVNGVITSHNEAEITNDVFGYSNTEKIIAQLGNRAKAANACKAVVYKNGNHGYLPAIGEWKITFKYFDEVNSAITVCGGTSIPLYADYWTSTQCPQKEAWEFRWCHAEHDCVSKSTINKVRPFAKLPEE